MATFGATPGERYVSWARAELAAGVRERPPGSNSGERIATYHSCAERHGRPLGLRRGPWCASAYSFGLIGVASSAAELPDGFTPRCSGYELEQDAIAHGTWRPVDMVRDGLWAPTIGDCCMLSRGGQSWQRHVCAVCEELDTHGCFATIGGNENDRWQETGRDIQSGSIRGFIELPRPGPVVSAVLAAADAVGDAASVVERALADMDGLYG